MITELTVKQIPNTFSCTVSIKSDDKEDINYAFDNVNFMSIKDRLIEAYDIYESK